MLINFETKGGWVSLKPAKNYQQELEKAVSSVWDSLPSARTPLPNGEGYRDFLDTASYRVAGDERFAPFLHWELRAQGIHHEVLSRNGRPESYVHRNGNPLDTNAMAMRFAGMKRYIDARADQ